MKSLLSISFSILYILQAFGLNMDFCCEIQKLPALFEHYEVHRNIDGDSFFEFIAEDYLAHDGNHQGHHDENHDDLPFHGQHQCNHAPVHATTTLSSFELKTQSFYIQANGSFYHLFYTSEYLVKLIQPPQG